MDFDAFVKDIVSSRWQVHGSEVYDGGQQII